MSQNEAMIRIKRETRDSLKDLGKKGETYDTIISRAIKSAAEEQSLIKSRDASSSLKKEREPKVVLR